MSEVTRKCPDCKTEMVEGFILDMSDGSRLVPRWLAGSPDQSAFMGVKTKGKECRSVESHRCPKCGLLRSYALVEVDPPSIWGT